MQNLYLALLNKTLDDLLDAKGLILVEPAEEGNVSHCISCTRLAIQVADDRLENVGDVARVVLIVGVEPAGVHMRVRHKVHLYLLRIAFILRPNAISIRIRSALDRVLLLQDLLVEDRPSIRVLKNRLVIEKASF